MNCIMHNNPYIFVYLHSFSCPFFFFFFFSAVSALVVQVVSSLR